MEIVTATDEAAATDEETVTGEDRQVCGDEDEATEAEWEAGAEAAGGA